MISPHSVANTKHDIACSSVDDFLSVVIAVMLDNRVSSTSTFLLIYS